jgi:predicted metal-dependent hydrolase
MNIDDLDIEIRYMKRRTISLMISYEGKVLIKAPNRTPEKYILDFVASKQTWIEKKLHHTALSHDLLSALEIQNLDPIKQKKIAKQLVLDKINFWSEQMSLRYEKVRLSSAKTRWGSCTSTNIISINWRLSLLPLKLIDYVVIHELAHIKEKNHSSKFWDIVEKYCSDYKVDRKLLKSYGRILTTV